MDTIKIKPGMHGFVFEDRLDAIEFLNRNYYPDAAEALLKIEYEGELNQLQHEEALYREQLEAKAAAARKQRQKPRPVKHLVLELCGLFGLLRYGEIYLNSDIAKVVGEEYKTTWPSSASNIISRAIRWAAKDGVYIKAIRGVGYRRVLKP